jgi:hypothetical protein
MKTAITAFLCLGIGLFIGRYASFPSLAPASGSPSERQSAVPRSAREVAKTSTPFVGAEKPVSGNESNAEADSKTLKAAAAEKLKEYAIAEIKRRKVNETEIDYKPFLDRLRPEVAAVTRGLLTSKLDVLDLVQAESAKGASRADQTAKGKSYLQDIDKQLREVLGPDDFQALADFTKALPYVKATEKINERFYSENVSLNEDQKGALLQALINSPKPRPITDVVSGKISKEDYIDSVEGSSQVFIGQTAKFLTPKQQALLVAQETSDRATLATRVDLAILTKKANARPGEARPPER